MININILIINNVCEIILLLMCINNILILM